MEANTKIDPKFFKCIIEVLNEIFVIETINNEHSDAK